MVPRPPGPAKAMGGTAAARAGGEGQFRAVRAVKRADPARMVAETACRVPSATVSGETL